MEARRVPLAVLAGSQRDGQTANKLKHLARVEPSVAGCTPPRLLVSARACGLD